MRSLSIPGFLLLAVLGAVCFVPTSAEAQFPDPDKYRLQWNGRLLTGFGTTLGQDLHRHFIMETEGRVEFLWGKPGDRHFRLGPMGSLRTASFKTIEGALGGTLLIPTWPGYPIALTGFGGYAFRKDVFGGNGMFAGATLEWGYRPYNHHGYWQLDFGPYVTGRYHFDGGWEITAGIDIDFGLVAVPAIMLVNVLVNRSDPDEAQDAPPVADPGRRTSSSSTASGTSTAGGTPASSAASSSAAPAPASDAPAPVPASEAPAPTTPTP